MSKSKRPNNVSEAVSAAKRARAESLRADQREGRVLRAATFTDRRREAARKACRGKVAW